MLFDSTLARSVIVADTTSATANAYTPRPGTLIRYRGDTALLIAPSSLSMLVLGPTGNIVRVMAIPRSNEAQAFGGGNWGTPGFDARGRLIYFNTLGVLPGVTMLRPQEPLGLDGEPISLSTSRYRRIRHFIEPARRLGRHHSRRPRHSRCRHRGVDQGSEGQASTEGRRSAPADDD